MDKNKEKLQNVNEQTQPEPTVVNDVDGQTILKEQLEMISAFDQRIRSIEDIYALPTCPEIMAMVKSGYLLSHAFIIANLSAILEMVAGQARQVSMNSFASRGHLSAINGASVSAGTVPPDILKQYKRFNPKATDAQITAHWNAQKR